MSHVSFVVMLYDSYESYYFESKDWAPPQNNQYKWFKSRLILVTSEKNFFIWYFEKKENMFC